jgi:hypothetical protein
MRKTLLISICLTLLASILMGYAFGVELPIRIVGGKTTDYKDSKGNIWFSAQKPYDKDSWGGWVGVQPLTAEVRNLTPDAQKKAKDAGFDPEIFYAVSWNWHPTVVKIDVNTGNGTFTVTYLVGEHWSPKNRGFDIVIEGEKVKEKYVTPGRDEIDILTFKGIVVKDEVMRLEFPGNPATGCGDLNGMFSGLVIDKDITPVDPKDKLATTWGLIKR